MKSRILRFVTALTLFTSLATPARLAAQDQEDHSVIAGTANPVPLINQPMVPGRHQTPGAQAGFTLTVNGTGFVSGSVVSGVSALGYNLCEPFAIDREYSFLRYCQA